MTNLRVGKGQLSVRQRSHKLKASKQILKQWKEKSEFLFLCSYRALYSSPANTATLGCNEYRCSGRGDSGGGSELENSKAVETLRNIERRLDGIVAVPGSREEEEEQVNGAGWHLKL